MNPSTLLFAGETLDGRDPEHAPIALRDGSTPTVRVRIVPARHLLALLDLFDTGKEAELLERTLEVIGDPSDRSDPSHPTDPKWSAASADLVDSLEDPSHERLVALATSLNFARAVSLAERQIANGTKLCGVKERMAKQMIAPLRREFESLTQSLTQALSSALVAKKP
jgi:hypothetical protein